MFVHQVIFKQSSKKSYLLKQLFCNPFKNSNTTRNRIGVSYSTLPNLMFLAETPSAHKNILG